MLAPTEPRRGGGEVVRGGRSRLRVPAGPAALWAVPGAPVLLGCSWPSICLISGQFADGVIGWHEGQICVILCLFFFQPTTDSWQRDEKQKLLDLPFQSSQQ